MSKRDPALTEAIQRAGGIRAVSQALGLTFQAVWQWRQVPPRHVVALERLSGVKREQLRPDIFGRQAA